MRLMRDFKETFRSRNALKDSGLRAGIRIAFTDYGQGCATDCAGQRLPDWVIYSGPATFFPFGDRAPRPSVHPGQQRPKGCLRRVPVRKRKSCVFAGTVHKRHLPGGAGEALSKRPRRGGLSGFPPAGCRAATLSADPRAAPLPRGRRCHDDSPSPRPQLLVTCTRGGGSRGRRRSSRMRTDTQTQRPIGMGQTTEQSGVVVVRRALERRAAQWKEEEKAKIGPPPQVGLDFRTSRLWG